MHAKRYKMPIAMGKCDPVSHPNAGTEKDKKPSKATLAIRFDPTTMLLQVENVIPIALMFVVFAKPMFEKIW
jgi:hypothetical protein